MSLDLDFIYPDFNFTMDKLSHHSIYEFERFKLDAVHLMLYRENEEIPLPPKAVETLLVLVERRGEILSKNDLMEIIWADTIVEESNLAKYLHVLRRTLGETSSGKPFIETFRRRGYRFNGDVRIGESSTTPESGNINGNVPPSKAAIERTDQEPETILEIAPSAESPRVDRSRKIIPLAGAIVFGFLILGLGFFLFTGFRAESLPSSAAVRSIAVLPFLNNADNADIEYLSDGITESIINNLSELAGLKVMSRNSAFRFKDNQTDTRQIASRLGVETLVTGDIRQIGDKLVINVRLINANNDSQIWGSQYVKNSADIITTQNEIAQAIAGNLRLKLTNSDRSQLDNNYPKSPEAYHLYLKGRYHMLKFTPAEMRKSIQFSRQAIDTDPTYALAYVGLADAYRLLAIAGEMPPNEAFPKAKAALAKALEINEMLADAHNSSGSVKFWFDWDWPGAETEFRRAFELGPNNASSRPSYAHFLSNMGRFEEAVAEVQKAREHDPLSLTANSLEGLFLFYAGRENEAIARLQKTFEIEPNFWVAHLNLAKVYISQKNFDAALRELKIAEEFSGRNAETISLAGYTHAISGRREQAEGALDELKTLAAEKYVPSYHIALICNGLDRRDETFAWLERAFQEHDVFLSFVKVDPKWDSMRSDSRFANLLKKMNLE